MNGMIGKHYRVKLDPKYFKTVIKSGSKTLMRKYQCYGNLHDKEVIVLSDYPSRSSTAYKVALAAENDDYWFIIDKKYLVPIIKLSSKCICETRTLMCRGCLCGAFKFEKSQAEKEDATGYIEPW